MSQNEEDERRRQFEQEGEALLIKGRVTKLEHEQEESKKRDEEYKERQILYTKRVAWFTLALVLTSLVTNVIYLDMSCTARKSAESARIAANASVQASCTAAKALKDSETSFAQTLCQMKAQTAAQQESANTGRKEMELSNRPWLTAEIKPASDLSFDNGRATLFVKVDITNTGHSPAMGVLVSDPRLTVIKTADIVGEESRTCDSIAKTFSKFGVSVLSWTVFPGGPVAESATHVIGMNEKQLSAAIIDKATGMISPPQVFICARYKFPFASGYHYTGSSFLLQTQGGMYVGRNVPQSRLVFTRFGPETAN